MGSMRKTGIMFAFIFIIVGGAGCMQSEDQVLNYVEEKYDEKFEVEAVKEGSEVFPEMYGKDSLFAYPEGKPDYIFVAGESKNKDGEYYDTYILSRWGEELKQTYQGEIENELPGESLAKFYLHIADSNYDASMKDLSVFDYFKEVNQDAELVLKIGIITDGEPKLEDYQQGLFNLYQLLKGVGTEVYTLSVGFVDVSQDEIDEYIRVSSVNNLAWSNFSGVYGDLVVTDVSDLKEPRDLIRYYQSSKEQ